MTSAAKWKEWRFPECASALSLSPPVLTRTLAHPQHTHTLSHSHSQSWTLKHEMNMSSMNFDWHFHTATGLIEHYTYQSELVTIKNSLSTLQGVGWGQ